MNKINHILFAIIIISLFNPVFAADNKVVVIPLMGSDNDVLKDTDWTSEGFLWNPPFSDSGSFPSEIKFKKIGTTVYLRGYANAGSTRIQSGQKIGTLPEEYRPTSGGSVMYVCPTWGWPSAYPNGYVGSAGIQVWNNGEIHITTVHQYDGEQQYMIFVNKSFPTD